MMAEPLEYSTFGKMMMDHAPYILMGGVSIIGLTMLILRKAGVLFFGDEKKQHEDCKHCSHNGDLLTSKKEKCTSHDELHEKQTAMLAQQKLNTAQLRNGKKEFKVIKDDITELKVGVGILLDRSGGRPIGFTELK